jgi:hypothetical protein
MKTHRTSGGVFTMQHTSDAEAFEAAVAESDRRRGRMDLPTKTAGIADAGPVRWDGQQEAYVTRQTPERGTGGAHPVVKMRIVSHRRQQVTLSSAPAPFVGGLSALDEETRRAFAAHRRDPVYFREGELVYVTQMHGRVVKMRAHKVRGEQVTLVPVPDRKAD